MTKRLLLLGAGGHCAVVLDSVKRSNEFDEVALIANHPESTKMGHEVEIIGCDDDLEDLHSKGYNHAFVAVGSIGDYDIRKKLFNILQSIGFTIPNIIDKSANISDSVILGKGIYIGKNCCINARACIGDCSIINTGTIIEHDCRLGEFVHISPGVTMCGNVFVDDGGHIGAGAIVRQNIKIGSNTLVGVGSVVVKNIGGNVVAFGNPCKEQNK